MSILCYNSSMKRLWAPWRMKFVGSKQNGCAFCDVLRSTDDAKHYVIWRGEHAFVMLNLYPYNTGHLLVIANAHVPSFENLQVACRTEMMELTVQSMIALRQVYQPHGFNVGANIGEAAGAGIPGHVHLHILPRWTGDASFTLTLAETKVLPETLEQTYQRVRQAWETLTLNP
jgi:ATP adenylyltransferase